jgi:coenzyme F390 synthetase
MVTRAFYQEAVERLPREELNALIDERVRYTIGYAFEHSPFYRSWFGAHGIDPAAIRSHEDLLELPIISGKTIEEHQPPFTDEFMFRSVDWEEVFTIHETSGSSGTPKSFFLTWDDWLRYAEKYARSFISQGFGRGDRIVICSSYGMNVGANTMTLAARDIGMTIIPIGKCTFPSRVISNYRPTGIVGSVFKLLHLAQRMTGEGLKPEDSSVKRLVVGGESFADESRAYLSEVWQRDVYNTYGSTEGTMCGECVVREGLHIPEDLVHLDVYDPDLKDFVKDGECGRAVLTTLIPVGGHAGTLLINYDTEDTTVVMTREPCPCGRTHMKITNPQREVETVWILGTPVNRVDIERGVFQRGNMAYLTGEYEAFVYGGEEEGGTTLRVSMECTDPSTANREEIAETFSKSFFKYKPALARAFGDGFSLIFNFAGPGELELFRIKGRPKRLVDRRA